VRQLNEDEDADALDLFEWADEEPEFSPAPANSH
jgi:hypothetical protein